MDQQLNPHLSTDKHIWSQIYRTLKEMLKSQRSQIKTLINDREFLENNFCIQHECWSSRERFLESCIAQMKEEQAKTRLVEDAKMLVWVGLKESEALSYRMQLELAESDLEEFRSCVEVVNAEMEELKEKLKVFGASEVKNTDYIIDHPGSSENLKGRNQLTTPLKKEIKKLKHAYRELSSRRDTEISALLAEKDFVWNQFRKMESDYIALCKSKRTEADLQSREAADKLQDSVEKLQQEINNKDEIIVKLEAERSMIALDARKLAEEVEQANNKMKMLHTDMDELRLASLEKEKLIDNLRKELCNLKTDLKKNSVEKSISLEKIKSERKSQNGSSTIRQIHLQRCSKKRNLESCDNHTSQKHTNSCGVTSEKPASDNDHKLGKSMTEKKGRFLSPVGMQPSLFHSDFKVPKLKRAKLLI
ncbi:uncharacterized protein PFB0145c-like [Dendrobium catenatum]|uniref:Uncharacterized protein n=1 Tax=Dendrobium catenatum TaxID=906689 RepID=A0A2I0WYP7_9ASPA|nr:uncharacterized protein PFB0145c-like [Dendrobium catenatum]PKU80790.1 hypothetical protein MA16_Dca014628 [Dendrobium catenatum]